MLQSLRRGRLFPQNVCGMWLAKWCAPTARAYVRDAGAAFSLPAASIHTSAPLLESKRKRVARLRRQKNLAQQNIKQRMFEMSKPDPVLAHRLNEQGHATWANSELAKLILSKTEVWGLVEDRRGRLQTVSPLPREEDAEVDTVVEEFGGPRRLNFGLDTRDRRTLFQSLPRVMTTDRAMDLTDSVQGGSDAFAVDLKQLEEEQAQSAETLSRILDLRNASGRGIQVENTRRIIAHFGRSTESGGADTGSPEVQAALLTYRIRNLAEHLQTARHDNSNRRSMRHMVHQRAKILRYLKSRDPVHYQKFLPRIGVEARGVEGEIIVPGKPKVRRM